MIICIDATPGSGGTLYAVPQALEKASPAVARSSALASGGRTIRVGDHVVKNGQRLKVQKISKRGVVTLGHTCGGFAMFSFVTACVACK